MTAIETAEYHRKWRLLHQDDIRRYRQNNKKKQKEWSRLWRESHRDKWRGYVKEWKANNRDKCRKMATNSRLKTTYGITISEYENLLSKQNGCCAICGKSSAEYKRRLHVDHNHLTGNIRGLLCVRCNSGLGNFQEMPVLLDKAKQYLASHL